VANADARRALAARLRAPQAVTVIEGAGVADLVTRSGEAFARLSDGRQVHARLVVAADGRDSPVREAAGIGATRWAYGQRALVFRVAHDMPHGNVSTEIHSTGGPCTLVPMPDHEGRPSSSVVWMTPGPRAEALMAADDARLGAALTAETMGLFGPLEVVSDRAAWPMIGQIAHRMAGERVALVAEAAHVIPPIGAQGLNMSLADIECLAALAEGAADPGEARLLAAYERRRWPETAARVAGIDVLNRAAMAEAQPVRDLRRIGLEAIHGLWPVRRLAMRLGMGAGG
jgi:2-octaprenyl-6-methoxyphenol hydroxylase